jgi:hypothetical protein
VRAGGQGDEERERRGAAHFTAQYAGFLRSTLATEDDLQMRKKERRTRRASTITQALIYQLDACCRDGDIQAMVVADTDGLALAASGDAFACDEVAARAVLIGTKIRKFSGTMLGLGRGWDVEMEKVKIDGSELLVCAVGGKASERKKQIERGARGALRILAAA